MTSAAVSRAVKLCGTEQPDVVGRVLEAGPLSVELDNGNLRYLKVGGVEVLRSLAFLVRDENWGTYVPTLSNVVIDQRADGFSVSYRAVCSREGQEIGYEARIEGRGDGSLEFSGTATPVTDFLTARTGFVVLHPLQGVAGRPVEVEHVDGQIVKSTFPALVNPVQPFLNIRSLAHEVVPGLQAVVRMEGDTFEMEDHRNWTDASFKTYVRPLALPWPYTLKAGETVQQSVKLSLVGAARAVRKSASSAALEVRVGAPTNRRVPAIGLGMPAEEIGPTLASIDLVERVAPRLLIGQFDPRAGHGRRELEAYRQICERTGAECELEVVVQSIDQFAEELSATATLVREAGLNLSAVAVCPVGDLKSVLPGGVRPPAPPLADLYRAARAAFPAQRLGGGMFSFFTELNRKRPPAELLDFVHNSTCPIVHAADDRSVMETHEALPYQVATARSFIGKTAYRVGPSAIGCRDNPHGKTFTPNPDNVRICLVKADPRQRALFGAAWAVGYAASFAPTGLEALSFGAPTGPLGVIHREGGARVPYFDALGARAVYPAYHVVAGLTRASGARIVACSGAEAGGICSFAYRGQGATLVWLANQTAHEKTVRVAAGPGRNSSAAFGIVLDENSFERATLDPFTFQAGHRALDLARLPLGPYAVALACIPDA
jgi:hypothetical protein